MAAAIHAGQRGRSVLVIEKNGADRMKPCGDGLTHASLTELVRLGISIPELISEGANEIRQSIHVFPGGRTVIPHSAKTCFSLRRPALMKLLRRKAEEAGVVIKYHTPFSAAVSGKCVIDASGCQSRKAPQYAAFPVGVSAVIQGQSKLSTDTFYFLHHKSSDNGYCWAFPLSSEMWNIGVWQQYDCNHIKHCFLSFEQNTLNRYFSNITYVRPPRGAKLGTIHPLPPLCTDCISCGDAAGLCSISSGEGISYALRSGIAAVDISIQQYSKSFISSN